MSHKVQLRTIVIVLISMFLYACQKEDQNFQYTKQNEITFKTDTNSFTVTQLDSFKLAPKLTESIPAGEEYTYNWEVYSSLGGTVKTTLSESKELKTKISLAPGSYTIRYRVISKRTGITYQSVYSLTVTGAFYQGYLVSSNRAGVGKLSFIRADDVVIDFPAPVVNGKDYPGKALGAFAAIDNSINLIYYFTDKGTYRFNANDFVENGRDAMVLSQGNPFQSSASYSLGLGGFDQYIVGDGKLYAGIGPGFYPAEVTKPFSNAIPGDYTLYPGIFATTQTATYFYDNKNLRFMQMAYLSRDLTNFPSSSTGTYNLGNVGKKMIGHDIGLVSLFDLENYFVMEDATGRYLYSLSGSTAGIAQKINNSPDILTATSFATSSILKHLYYASGNKVYVYDILANSSRLVYTFPSGYQIADIKMLRSTSKQLAVATNLAGNGEVYYFSLDNIGAFVNNTYTKKFTGFGEIAQINYRK